MIKNYFKIAWRNLVKSPFYTAVNILGLATGIAFTLLVAAYVWGELQVNSQLKNGKNQYIVTSKWRDPNMGLDFTSFGNLSKALKDNYPNLVANYYRWDGVTSTVSKGDKIFREGLQIGDSTLLTMYGFKLLYGDTATALNNPSSVVITEKIAEKYFGKKDVVGETLTIENFSGGKKPFEISAVMATPIRNSITSINEDNNNQVYISSSAISYFNRNIDNWQSPFIVSYIELKEGVQPTALLAPMKALVKTNLSAETAAALEPGLISLHDYYLSANNGLVKKTLYTLSFIALFILIMAIINFVNMCVSRSATRMKEIGVRKVMGGMKKQLIGQFLTESILTVLIATVLAIVLYQIARPYFGSMMGRTVVSVLNMPLLFIASTIIAVFVVGFLAGIYPAFVLSSINAADAVKGKLKQVKEKVWLRKSLVGFQFGTAAIVFISALVVTQQINLFFSEDLGYNKDYVMYVQLPRDWSQQGVQKMETIRHQFEAMPEVRHASLSFEIPNGKYGNNIPLFKMGSDSLHAVANQLMVTDNGYADVYSIPMAAGSFFTPVFAPADSAKIVINETACKALALGSPEQAINQQLRVTGSNFVFTVCGVTKDFHTESMQGKIQPASFMNVNLNPIYRVFSFKLKPGNIPQTVAALQKKFNELLPNTAFDYGFMDEALAKMYQSELQLKKASYIATALAMIIVLLGVIGLVSLSIQKRTKEIGIRKILGSSVPNIMALFIKDFVSVIFIASLIACPFAWYIMHEWLQGYAHRISISSLPFIITIVLLLATTAVLIIIQTFKTALDNPVKSLRTE